MRLQASLAKLQLLIIDELGYVPLSQTGAELLFEVISQRYERGSTIVTSNLAFEDWTSVFGSERLTGALLDRLTHHVHILEMNGDSYRLKQSKARKATTAADPTIEERRKSTRAPSRGRGSCAFRLAATVSGRLLLREWTGFGPVLTVVTMPAMSILSFSDIVMPASRPHHSPLLCRSSISAAVSIAASGVAASIALVDGFHFSIAAKANSVAATADVLPSEIL